MGERRINSSAREILTWKNLVCKGYCRNIKQGEVNGNEENSQCDSLMKRYCNRSKYVYKGMYSELVNVDEYREREGLRIALNELEPEECIIIVNLLMLDNEVSNIIDIMNEIHKKGAFVICLEPEFDTIGYWDTISKWISEFFALEKPELLNRDVVGIYRISENRSLRARSPFGWRFEGEDKRLIAIPEQQAVIKKIVKLYLKEPNMSDIARKLNQDGDNKTINMNKKIIANENPIFTYQKVRTILIFQGLIDGGREPAKKKYIEVKS